MSSSEEDHNVLTAFGRSGLRRSASLSPSLSSSSIRISASLWGGGEGDLRREGGGDAAMRVDVWSDSRRSDRELEGDANAVEEDREEEVDDLDTVRNQSGLRPEGLLRRVGRVSSRL